MSTRLDKKLILNKPVCCLIKWWYIAFVSCIHTDFVHFLFWRRIPIRLIFWWCRYDSDTNYLYVRVKIWFILEYNLVWIEISNGNDIRIDISSFFINSSPSSTMSSGNIRIIVSLVVSFQCFPQIHKLFRVFIFFSFVFSMMGH